MRLNPVLTALFFFCATVACESTPSDTNPGADEFSVVLDQLDGSVNAVFATSTSTLWAVGGRPGRALILRYDGTEWVRMDEGGGQELNWLWGPTEDSLTAVGAGGTIMMWDGTSWSESFAGTDADLHGVWGSSANDVWVVGGSNDAAGAQGVILHSEGSVWLPALESGLYAAQLRAVWGDSASRWIVGHALDGEALILEWMDDSWQRVVVGIDADLSAVHGRNGQVFAAGRNATQGILLERENTAWVTAATIVDADLTGVSLEDDALWVSGVVGYVASSPLPVTATSLVVEPTIPTEKCLNSIWASSTWGVWLIGGACPGETVDFGVVLHRGEPEIAGGPVKPWTSNPDGGGVPNDAGIVPDSTVDGPTPIGPGEECPTGTGCREDLECWFFAATYDFVCTHPCGDTGDCDEFTESCCQEPGAQTATTVCMPTSYGACL